MPPDLLPCKKVHPACCNFYLVPTTDYVIICNGGRCSSYYSCFISDIFSDIFQVQNSPRQKMYIYNIIA